MNYTEAITKLNYPNKKDSKKVANNTYLHKIDENTIGLKLHQTDVIIFKKTYCQLFTGGWNTLTTKDRLTNFSPVHIYQENHLWYLGNYFDKNPILFYEGIKIGYDGKILSRIKSDKKILDKNKKMNKAIKNYIQKAIKTVENGLPLPSGGDCWYCSMTSQTGEKLGDTIKNNDHLLSHFKEGYIVPSLLFNAVKEQGYRYPFFILGYNPNTQKTDKKSYFKEDIENSLKRYLQRRLLIK